MVLDRSSGVSRKLHKRRLTGGFAGAEKEMIYAFRLSFRPAGSRGDLVCRMQHRQRGDSGGI